MNDTSPILTHLGELEPLLREYQQVVAGASAERVFVTYRPEIQQDKKTDGHYISGTEAALTQAGFATESVRALLAKCSYYEASPESEIDPIDIAMIRSLTAVPDAQRKAARVMTDRYYFGGAFFSTR